MSVNRGAFETRCNSDFTNTVEKIHLIYGDIVVWETQRDDRGKELTIPPGLLAWFDSHLDHAPASYYLFPRDWGDIFATPMFHWRASPDDPNCLKDVTSCLDGEWLGQGSDGFCKMLDVILNRDPKPVLIFGSRLAEVDADPEWS